MTESAGRRPGIRGRPWWPWLKHGLTATFFVLLAWLLVRQARAIDWGEVWTALRNHPTESLAAGAAFALASHLLYSCFDLLGRHHIGHRIPKPKVMLTTFVSYAFNLNFGSLIGGLAFRYRLYSRMGLNAAETSQVVAVSMLTNWLGYTLLAGLDFLLRPFDLPADWSAGRGAIQALGAGLLCITVAYMGMCAFSKRRDWVIRGHELHLPSLRFAFLQLGMSSLNWALIGGAIYMLLQQRIDYPSVLGVLLVAAVAGVITHVPAGIGVLEAVFVALLGRRMPASHLLAGLLAYRALYYLAPLAVAIVAHLALEAHTREDKDDA